MGSHRREKKNSKDNLSLSVTFLKHRLATPGRHGASRESKGPRSNGGLSWLQMWEWVGDSVCTGVGWGGGGTQSLLKCHRKA